MKSKLYANIKRMTNLFCIGILGATLSVLTLRLTVFSDMAAAPPKAVSHMLTSEQDGYQINGRIYFSAADSKGDVFITNLEGNEFIIKVNVTLGEKGDTILSTGFISPGASRDSIKLNPTGQKLKDGVYECVAEITAHDPDTLKAVGSATENVEIYIGEKPESDKDKAKEKDKDEGGSQSPTRTERAASKGESSGQDDDDEDTEPAD